MSPGRLDADVDGYRQAGAANTPPPTVSSDPLAGGLSPIEQLVRVLGLAANLGDEQDNLDNIADHAERDVLTAEAATAFEGQDGDATAELQATASQDPSTQLAQQVPQLAAGLAGSLAGALGSAMQQFGQIPQQLSQGAQQAMQAGMGMLQQSGAGYAGLEGADPADPLDSLDTLDPMTEDFAADIGDLDSVDGDLAGSGAFGGGAATGAGAGGGAAPAVPLGPAPPPSAGTFLSSARSAAATAHAAPGPTPMVGGGMAGVPMVPPAAMNGAGGADKDGKTDTKRISVPPIRNGAPVQGRITTPAADLGAVRTAQGRPVATRRIMVSRDQIPQAADAAERP